MTSDWGELLFDTVLGGLPAVGKLVPARYKQRALARLNDVNPFSSVTANEDLLRALRLAWIEAALEIDAAVLHAGAAPEWAGQAQDIQRFSALLVRGLRALRTEAFDRDADPGHAPMDRHLREVIVNVPVTMTGQQPRLGAAMTDEFREIAAAVASWPVHEVPDLYEQIARDGLPVPGGSTRRGFGDLVYAAFAETIKSPDRYPEARQAFVVAIGGLGVELGKQSLSLLRGQDAKLDRLLEALERTSIEGGLSAWLQRVDADWAARWQALSAQVAGVDAKLDEHTHALSAMQGQLARLVAAVEAKGQIGGGAGQLAHDTVLALARRLRPDDLLDFDRAVKELEAVVGVVFDLMARGHSSHYQDRFVDDVLSRVRQSIEAGRLEQGAESIDQALAELDRREASEQVAARRRRAQLLEASVSQAMLLRDVPRAADAVERLVAIDHPLRTVVTGAFRDKLRAYCADGKDHGLRMPLELAVALARKQLAQSSGSEERGEALNDLGNALATLGDLDRGSDLLEEALRVFREALVERQRERDPLGWAATQNNLGNALQSIGERESRAERLEDAVAAYRAALLERTRERVPLDWATVQSNLGLALTTLGGREAGTDRLKEAERAFRNALEERTRGRAPVDWAMTQNNLGLVLHALAERESGSKRLHEAIAAYRDALQEFTRERAPQGWAMTQNNLGLALQTLGWRESDARPLEEAVQSFRYALLVRTRDEAPLHWAMTQCNLGLALCALGELQGDTHSFHGAVQAFEHALLEYTRERVPLDWAMTHNNLGIANWAIGKRRTDAHFLHKAVQCFRDALLERRHECVPLRWAETKSNLGEALCVLGERTGSDGQLEEAVQAFREALLVFETNSLPYHVEEVRKNLAKAETLLQSRRSASTG
jgi:tetratricopeptide (TPR) repeat protein